MAQQILHQISDAVFPPKPKYRLYYFDARGRAEVIRWIFAYAGVDYEDRRVSHEEWPAMKTSTPTGQMPYLDIDGKQLPQSMTIARFLARKHGVAGSNEWEAAQCDAIVDCVEDACRPLVALHAMSGDVKALEAFKVKFIDETSQPHLKLLERKLSENKNGEGYLVGEKPTWADFAVVYALDTFLGLDAKKTLLENYPLLKAHSQRVHDLKGIKEWLLKRPVTNF